MNAQPSIIQVPLSQLRLSPRNARKTGGRDIKGLAASIAAHNLLQNLTVTATDNGDAFEVVAGGRRLAAMQLLGDRGELDADYSVPCKLIADDDVALEASTAENTLREAMHPADQFEAFKGMVDAGKSVIDVAAHFGVGEIVVKQRLKLANVDPQLVQIYRDGGMQLDQLQALALTDDHGAQRAAWFKPRYDHERSACNIRESLTQREVPAGSGLAMFVGLDTYEAVGGPVRRDLFSARDEAWLQDKALLDALAVDKLEVVAEAERKKGWSWVETHLDMDYSQLAEYPQLKHVASEDYLAPERQARLDAVEARIQEIEKLADDALDAAQEDALMTEQESLETERDEITDEIEERWPADAMSKAGVLVRRLGVVIKVHRGRLKPGQKVTASGGVDGKAKDANPDKPKQAGLSQDMTHRLELHRAAAIREHVASDPAAALQLLLAHLLTTLLMKSDAGSLFDLAPKNVHERTKDEIDSKFADVGQSPARKALDVRLVGWKKEGLPGKAPGIHAWLGTLTEAKRLQLLALATALTLRTNTGPQGHALANQYGVDMTRWWTATPETFIGVVPKALLAEAVAEVAGKAAGEAIAALKKDGAIAEAAKTLAGTGWLPKPLRGTNYKLAGKGATTKKAAAKKAGKPSKKSAKTTSNKQSA